MTLTEITSQIEIPEGFEFDRIDTKTKDGDYYSDGSEITRHDIDFSEPRIILRKIKSKKPEYRVYRYKGERGSNTQDRYPDGKLSHIGDISQVVFMSDWIEYDPSPKKWPTPLVERIAAIDIEAAQWIVDHWDVFLFNNKNTEKLLFMFIWEDAPQGSQYWRSISEQLGEK